MLKHEWTLPLLLIAGVAGSSSADLGQPERSQDPAKVDIEAAARTLMGSALKSASSEALGVIVAIAGEPVFAQGVGPARSGKAAIADEDSTFLAAPMAHAWLVTAALQLEAAGKLNHEDRIATYLEGFVAKDCPVRVRELLANTSGLPDFRDFADEALLKRGQPTLEALSALVRDVAPVTAPGECVLDNATDTLFLAAVIEKASGQAVEEVLRSKIFERLDMEDTSYDPSASATSADASEATASQDKPLAFLPRGLISTPADLLRFQRGLVDLKLLDSDAVEAMNDAVRLSDGSMANTGMGARHMRLHEADGWVYGSSGTGGAAQVAYYPEFDLSIAVMARGKEPKVDELMRGLARIVIVEPTPTTLDLPLAEDGLRQYLGNYQIGCTTVVIRAEVARIVLDQLDEAPLVLLNQGGGRFIARDDPEVILTFEVDGEFARSFVLEKYGVRATAVRM